MTLNEQIMQLRKSGWREKDIAVELGLTEAAVNSRVTRMKRKLESGETVVMKGGKARASEADDIRAFRRQAIKAARELGYDKAYIKKLETVKTVNEIDRVMKNARHERFK